MPYISVIVTAYKRRQYLYNALLSLRAQTLSRNKYEVIVVKDFKDPQIDNLIKDMGWKSVYSNEEYQGRMYLNGLKEANGDIITFLDDDDTYMPNRLEYLYNTFTYNPDIGYLHHSYEHASTNGNISPEFEAEAPRNLVPQSELKLTWSEISRYSKYGYPDPILFIFSKYRLHPDVNSTSIAIKRELLERHANLLSELYYGPDCFFFASAITDKVAMFFSDAKLSTRTFHGGNFVSRLQLANEGPEEIEQFMRFNYNYYLSYTVISQKLLNYFPNFYACQAERHKLLYLNTARRFGKPTISLTPDRSVITWCCNAGICPSEFQL
jgi:glycosyltransferase involved in cell wall biosynthesis